MRAAGERADRGDVVRLDETLDVAGGLGEALALALQRDERQRRDDDLLAGRFEPFDRLDQHFGLERLALGADDLADMDPLDRRFRRDPGIEVAIALGRPIEEDRPERQLRRGHRSCRLRHRQTFR